MKKLLLSSVLCLVFSLACDAVVVSTNKGYQFTGAWYITKAPKPSLKDAGQIDVYVWDDYTAEADIWYNGEIIETAEGVWRYTIPVGPNPGKKAFISFDFNNGTNYSYSVFVKEDPKGTGWFGVGSFKSSPARTYAGKFRITLHKDEGSAQRAAQRAAKSGKKAATFSP